jgi:hypothetical protein
VVAVLTPKVWNDCFFVSPILTGGCIKPHSAAISLIFLRSRQALILDRLDQTRELVRIVDFDAATVSVKAGEAHPLFESRVVDKKLDVVRPCEGVIAEGEFH